MSLLVMSNNKVAHSFGMLHRLWKCFGAFQYVSVKMLEFQKFTTCFVS